MADALNETALKDIRPGQVRVRPLRATNDEVAFWNSMLSDSRAVMHIVCRKRRSDLTLKVAAMVSLPPPPPNLDRAFNTNDEVNMHVDSVWGFTMPDADGVTPTADSTNNAEMGARIVFLENQVSMLEADLNRAKLDAVKWEAATASQKKDNDVLLEELQRLRSMASGSIRVRTGDGSTNLEIAELKKQVRNEMREKIEMRADLRKTEVESDKLHQSNVMLNAEIEELQNRRGLTDLNVDGHEDNKNLMDEDHNDPNGGAVDIDVAWLGL